ncbi:serine/threonine protein kinase [Aphanomyces invadans]|uniref:Serine/threonine protein kinase n=1 Tax=Aphanomyces invadans TaxID=157072 RepID=A0A024U4G1_9STRA|nr:serine/threonine protein kinase [Aphanomyces invadans]ETW00483.1 serine/threonine protein kinase [Aphanomyces invadans]|eukprot:XP_008870618.1 serine/threonine protein kinase [Aphanomyces invadans]
MPPPGGDKPQPLPWGHMSIPLSAVDVHRAAPLNRSQYWDIFDGTYQGARVAVLAYRDSSRRHALWDATLSYLPRLFSAVHPNLVQVLGVAFDNESNPAMLVMDRHTTSLYELLHVHRIALSAAAIVSLALDILHAILFCNGRGLRHVTSRKVLVDACGRAKIVGCFQREIMDAAGAPAVVTPYSPQCHSLDSTAPPMADDMHVFGVLLWELCCGEIPTVELNHRIAQVSVMHPHTEFESLVRHCLEENPAHRPQPIELCEVLQALQVACPLVDDHTLVATRFGRPELAVSPREVPDAPGPTIVARMLEAVEAQVLEEQRNFDVVVGQLEFANTEIASLNALVATKDAERQNMHRQLVVALAEKDVLVQAMRDAMDARDTWEHKAKLLEQQVASLTTLNQAHLANADLAKHDHDRMIESAKAIQHERVEMTKELAAAQDAMTNEKALRDELNVRWQQTIKRVEDERRLREKAERMVTELRAHNHELLDQVKLWHPDTGTKSLERNRLHEAKVHALEQHTQQLLLEMVDFRAHMAMMEAQVGKANAALQVVESMAQCATLQDASTAMQNQLRLAQDICQARDNTIAQLESTTAALESKVAALTSELKATEDALTQEVKKRQDEGKRCLDLACDAPPFLIQPSGYCKTCDEKREREKAERIRKLTRERLDQTPDQLVRDASGRGLESLLDLLENFQTHVDVVVAGLKQLQHVSETNGNVKDSLGDAGAFKRIVAWMALYLEDVALQLAAVRLVGVLAFNHDVNRVRLVCDGCLEPLLAAMASHGTDKALQQACCTTLTNLAHNCEGNRRKILTQLGIERVLDSMQMFPHDTAIQQGCCWALISLAGSDFMCEHIAARGGVGGIVAAMLNCHADAAVQYYGSWALLNLVAGLESVQAFAKQEGAVEVCEAAMACFADHGGIQDKAGTVVAVLTDAVEQENNSDN